ncbi:MAG: aldo/keto reductase [Anaerolineales bacterium]
MQSPTLHLTEDIHIPQMGFGTYGIRPATEVVVHALRTGYRHLDTADIYGTHENCAEAIERSGVPRSEVFITTKLWSQDVPGKKVGPAVDRFLRELNTDYIDLLLIHWPVPGIPIAETLAAMDGARQAGKVRTLGVSNFSVADMEEALATGYPVTNNQIQYNLSHRPDEIVEYCVANNLTATAYSPVKSQGNRETQKLVNELASKYEVTKQEVMLGWLMAKGMIVIPRSSVPKNIETNFRSLQLKLAPDEVKHLDEQG